MGAESYGRGSGFLPRPPVPKDRHSETWYKQNPSNAEAAFAEGYLAGLAHALDKTRTASSVDEVMQLIEEAMRE